MFIKRYKKSIGMTLVEVLLSILILSFAAIFIFKSFFVSLSVMNQMSTRLDLMYAVHDKITEVKTAIEHDKKIPYATLNGTIEKGNSNFIYRIKTEKISEDSLLHSVDCVFFWREGKLEKKLTYQFFCNEFPLKL